MLPQTKILIYLGRNFLRRSEAYEQVICTRAVHESGPSFNQRFKARFFKHTNLRLNSQINLVQG